MKARLIERDERAEQIREYALSESEFLIGRGSDCNLRLRTSSISRHHCMIRLSADEATLMDLGSSNGTFLNGQRVRSQTVLHTGDELTVGSFHFVVDLHDQVELDMLPRMGADSLATTLHLKDGPAKHEGPPAGKDKVQGNEP